MGGGRKHKSGSSSSSRSTHSNNKSSHHQTPSSPKKHKAVVDDQLRQCMQVQVFPDQQSYSASLKECTLLLLTIAAMGITCLLAGFWAGNAISIHYYEEQNAVPSRRVTSMDGEIQNVLERVLKDVYESELPPLHSEQNDTTTSNTTTQTIVTSEPTIRPTLCSDGVTMGFHDWNTLKDAIHEANRLSAENFLKLNQFMADREDNNSNVQPIDDDVSLYYEKDVFFTICPDTTLYARKGPIFINAENIVLECDGCTIEVGGSHFSFGPHAKNVLVRGITFRGAQTSSLTFYHDGCDAAFEDCYWYGNAGTGKSGAVADVNSTSSVVFYRCEIDDAHNKAKYSPRGGNIGISSSLSIRA